MRSRLVATTLVLACLGAYAEAQVKLAYKFPEGRKATYRTSSKNHQVLTIAGMDVETTAEEAVVLSLANGKRSADGTLPITQKIESLRASLALPGGINVAFDSADPDAKIEDPRLAFLADVYKTMIGVSYTVVLDANDRVKFIEGTEKLTAKVDALEPSASALLRGRLNPEELKRSFVQSHANLPTVLAREGEPWELTELARIGNGQSLTFRKRYEYLGTVARGGRALDKIGVKAIAVTYAMDPDSPSPVKATRSDLKVDSSDGTLLFDRDLGAVIESQGKSRIKGVITLTADGKELPSTLDLTIESSSTRESSAP